MFMWTAARITRLGLLNRIAKFHNDNIIVFWKQCFPAKPEHCVEPEYHFEQYFATSSFQQILLQHSQSAACKASLYCFGRMNQTIFSGEILDFFFFVFELNASYLSSLRKKKQQQQQKPQQNQPQNKLTKKPHPATTPSSVAVWQRVSGF